MDGIKLFFWKLRGKAPRWATNYQIIKTKPNITRFLSAKPVLDRLIIKQSEAKNEVAGMIIPESERQKPLTGTVVAAGPGFRNSKGDIVPMTAKVGDEVMYMEHSATKVEIDGVDYIYIKEGDLILVF